MMEYHELLKDGIKQKLNSVVREETEAQQGQLLIIPSIETIIKILGSIYDPERFTTDLLNNARNSGINRARTLSNNFKNTSVGRRRYNTLLKRKNEIKFKEGLVLEENVFLVTSFNSSVNSVRDTIIESLQLTSRELGIVRRNVQKGHGEAGLAVSQVQVAGSIKTIPEIYRKQVIDDFKLYISSLQIIESEKLKYLELIEQIETGYLSLVSKNGAIKSKYFSKITLQTTGDNGADSKIERRFVNFFAKFMASKGVKILKIKNSPSLEEKLTSFYINSLVDGVTKNKKVKVSKSKTINPHSIDKDTIIEKNKSKQRKIVIKQKPISTKSKKLLVKKESAINLGALKAQINARLSKTVMKNMGAPALESRTGRFARSATVTNITETAKGFPSISYTYQKYPYQTFEPGYKQGSAQRDPRTLIDRSIRDIAKDLIVGRFYTRRV